MILYLYDESHTDTRNVQLTNLIKTITNYNGVKFSLPSGVARITSPDGAFYTHIKFTYNALNVVAVIERIEYVNTSVIDLYYNIDYIKSYFANNTLSNLKGYIYKSNTRYNKYIKDNSIPISPDLTVGYIQGNTININNMRWACVLSEGGGLYNATNIYLITSQQLLYMQGEINNHINADVIRSQFIKIYLLPFYNELNDLPLYTSSGIPVKTNYKGTTHDRLLSNDTIPVINIGINTLYNASVTINSGITTPLYNYLDLSPYTQYILNVPFIGRLEITPETLMIPYATIYNFTPKITYSIDLSVGAIAGEIENQLNTKSSYIELPTYSLAVTDGNSGQFMVNYNSMSQFATGLLTGNLMTATTSAGLSYVNGTVQNEFAHVSGGGVTSNATMFKPFFELTKVAHKPLIPFNDFVSLYCHTANELITNDTTHSDGELMMLNVNNINARCLYKSETINALNTNTIKF